MTSPSGSAAAASAASSADAQTSSATTDWHVQLWRDSGSGPDPNPPAIDPSDPAHADRRGAYASLMRLKGRYRADAPHAPFISGFTQIVFGEGDPRARLMFIGEAPGADEDRTGRPFVGRAGQLLDKMIVAMGLSRSSVYIANVLKVRPPNNATPTIEEAAASEPYLIEQIGIVRPEAIVTLGLPASRLVLKSDETMGRMRGTWRQVRFGEHTVDVMPTFHPAFLLRQYTDENRSKVWSDLKQVCDKLGISPTAPKRAR